MPSVDYIILFLFYRVSVIQFIIKLITIKFYEMGFEYLIIVCDVHSDCETIYFFEFGNFS